MVKTVRLSLDEQAAELLKRAEAQPADVFRLGLAELERRLESETYEAWVDSLPELELSEEDLNELDEALKEAEREPGQVRSAADIL